MSDTCITATIIKKPVTVTVKKQDAISIKMIQRGLSGEKGEAGDAAAANTTNAYTAGENLSALKLVCIDTTSGELFLADSVDVGTSYTVIGMTLNAVNAGEQPNILFEGPYIDSGWSWNMASDVSLFLGANGLITQTPPTSGYLLRVGFATSSQSIFLHLSEPVILT